MFVVYFDDSGTHPASDVAVAACYVGDSEQWRYPEKDWEDARKTEGFKAFGTADILGGKEGFRAWPKDKRERLILRLIAMTRLRVRSGFAYCVIKSDYDAEITDKLRDKVGRFHYSFV